jgi:aquaporin Z
VSFAVGLAVMAGAYAFGPISGGHFNPAVTLGLAAAGRFPWGGVLGYIVAQIVGGAVATSVLVLIGLFGPDGWLGAKQDAGFASNGWGVHSPGGFGLGATIVVEVLFTAIFVTVILGVTHRTRGNAGLAGLVIGLTLTLIHLATIPVDNTSVNPARSIATAIYGGTDALAQVWVFIVFPIVGALIAGLAYRALFDGVKRA